MGQPIDQFSIRMRQCAAEIETGLDQWLTDLSKTGGGTAPDRLVGAMRHGCLGGGKRLRPFLLRQTAQLFGLSARDALHPALALEAVHCYSLIHDDLPAMDDDDLRRGRPTVHRAYDEATAILAGDALLTHAFGLLADPRCHPDAAIRARLVGELVHGAGIAGMAGGQMRDIEGEAAPLSPEDIEAMQAMKTGALIRAAVRMGAILGQADESALAALSTYADAAGLAFQLADDLLDVTATQEAVGKATGKDSGHNKQTLVLRLGLAAARARLDALVATATGALTPFGAEADVLRAAGRYVASRET